MLGLKAWIQINCKFAQFTPTVEDVNTREPGIKDAKYNYEYYGRDAEGEKIYEPYLIVTYISQPGGKYETQYIDGYGKGIEDLNRAYHAWAQKMKFVPLPIKDVYDDKANDSHDDYNRWEADTNEHNRQKQEMSDDRDMAQTLKTVTPKPTSKWPEKLR